MAHARDRNRFCTGPNRTFFIHSRAITMKIWIFACGALAMIAASAAYTFTSRHARRGGKFADDQVSSEWLATAKIHEDQGW